MLQAKEFPRHPPLKFLLKLQKDESKRPLEDQADMLVQRVTVQRVLPVNKVGNRPSLAVGANLNGDEPKE